MWTTQPDQAAQATALIVDDEPGMRDELRDWLHQLWPALRIVGHAADGAGALQQVELLAPDIVFLDIQIPEPGGLDVARLLRDTCHIVFVTAFDEHAIEAFEHGAVDYLLKPIDPDRMAMTVRRLQQRLAGKPADLSDVIAQLAQQRAPRAYLRWITASAGNSIRLITTDEVIFFQSDQKYTRVVLEDAQVLIKKTLKELVSELDPGQFWQTHRSTVVNALEIASVEPNMAGQLTLTLKRRRELLPVAESFVRRFRQM